MTPSNPAKSAWRRPWHLMWTCSALLAGLASAPAQAVPSYARQTGMDCSGCHVGAFGPQLTPAGVMFKIGGYTDTDGKAGKVPLSGMVVGSWTRTKADQDPAPDHLKANNNFTLDEASLFIAGRLGEQVGTFVQITHNGVDHSTALDQTDVRWAHQGSLAGRPTIFGVSVNNNPTVQDPFNSSPIWSFPFAGSPAGFGAGEAATLINGGLEGRVTGASAYAFWDKALYAELGSYRSLSPTLQRKLGLGEDAQRLGGNAYWRLAWFRDMKSQAFNAGVFGWNARLEPDRSVSAPRDRYNDIGIDGSWQYLGTREHLVTVNGSYVRERKTEGSSGDASRLNEARLNASYHYQQTWGLSGGWFSTRGSDAAARTQGTLLQADWTPWGKDSDSAPSWASLVGVRLGAQYTRYSTFAGASEGASDHNTAFVFAWTAF